MKAIQKINNNVALCIDANGNQLVAFGKGLGFPSMPYEITDLTKVDRTFYSVKSGFVPLFQSIDEEVFAICTTIIDYARLHINKDIADSFYYILVDHLNFAIERARKNIYIPMKLSNDIKYLYPEEISVGLWAVELINERFKVKLPRSEASMIAVHILECEESKEATSATSDEDIIDEIGNIVEKWMGIKINKDGFNFIRFVSHVEYLLQRKVNNDKVSSENLKLYNDVSTKFPKIKECVIQIKDYLFKHLNYEINEEEQLYLMLHINRLCSREDCNQ